MTRSLGSFPVPHRRDDVAADRTRVQSPECLTNHGSAGPNRLAAGDVLRAAALARFALMLGHIATAPKAVGRTGVTGERDHNGATGKRRRTEAPGLSGAFGGLPTRRRCSVPPFVKRVLRYLRAHGNISAPTGKPAVSGSRGSADLIGSRLVEAHRTPLAPGRNRRRRGTLIAEQARQ